MKAASVRDERMSWGLQFYEQQEMVNRAHFPEIYSKSQHSPRSSHNKQLLDSSSDEESDELSGRIKNNQLEESKEIVDWKYEHPKNLRAVKSGGDAIDDDEFYMEDHEEDDPFQ